MSDPVKLQTITIDFETYYDKEYSLSKMTTEAYVRDPRFEVIGVGMKVGDWPAVWHTPESFRDCIGLYAKSGKPFAFLAHHAHFDGLILSHHYGYIPAFWFDTLSMARALHGVEVGGSLAKLMPHYGVGEKGHEVVKALGKHLKDFSPQEYAAYGAYCRNDCKGAWQILQKMLWTTGGGYPQAELRMIDTTVRMFTEPSFRLDEPLLQDYLKEEQARKADLLARIAQDKSVLMSNDKFASLLETMGEEPPIKKSPKKKNPDGTPADTFAFAKTDSGFQALLEHPRDEIRFLAEARLGVKSTINETRTERFLKSGANGRPVPVYLKYGAAHTLRWGGGDKMNFQNLMRGGTLRRALLAPPGKVLVVADSAQIEARVTAWLAGHAQLLQAFRENRDVYSEFATQAYRRQVTKANKIERFVGKTCVLGLGYQMAWRKFAGTMLQGAMGGPPVQFTAWDAAALKVNIPQFGRQKLEEIKEIKSRLPLPALTTHCAVAKEFVDRYRQSNAPIVQLWSEMEGLLRLCEAGGRVRLGPVQSELHCIALPNGMRLRYPDLRFTPPDAGRHGFYSYRSGRDSKRAHLYGGKLTENIVQALARIIVAEQMLAIRAAGFPIVTMTHDEVVALAPEKDGSEALEFMLAEMRKPPEWAEGLPLNAEGGFGTSYGDVK